VIDEAWISSSASRYGCGMETEPAGHLAHSGPQITKPGSAEERLLRL